MPVLAVVVAFVAYAGAQTIPSSPPTLVPTKAPPKQCSVDADCGESSDPYCKYKCGPGMCMLQCSLPEPELPKQPTCNVAADCGKAEMDCGYDCLNGQCAKICQIQAQPQPLPGGNGTVEPEPRKQPTCKVAADCGKAEMYCGYDCIDGQCAKFCQAQPQPQPPSEPRPLPSGSGTTSMDDKAASPVTETTSASTLTCIEIKSAYQEQGCCKNPLGSFSLPMKRRLLGGSGHDESDDAYNDILGQIEAGMAHMRHVGGAAKAEILAQAVIDRLAPYAAGQDHMV